MNNYYLGLDVGTNSVGWAVTDEKYNLIKAPVKGKYKNHDMWGIRLFESAETAEQRRTNRSMRRRMQRRKDRIKLLQSIFAEEMQKIDDTFFIRLNESRLNQNDRSTNSIHPLFNDEKYTDKEYFQEYPTIFHLRKELIYNQNRHDIRMVYLALHNIIKYRGNFLVEGNLSADEQKNIHVAFDRLCISFEQYGYDLSCNDICKMESIILDKKMSKSDKARQLKDLIEISAKDELIEIDTNKVSKVVSILLVGNKGNIKDIFYTISDEEIDEETANLLAIKLSESKYEESQRDALQAVFPNEVEVIDAIKSFYDWSVFMGIMGEYIYISDAKVDAYNRHKKNLATLKGILKKYLSSNEYKEFFHSKEDKSKSYAAYVGMCGKNGMPINKCTEEDFYKELKKILETIKDKIEENDYDIYEKCLLGAENKDLLPTLRNKDNGSIPRQIHEQELKIILENASKYLPFLNEIDAKYNKSNIEKIISIFEFKVPYYVGPLSTRHAKEESGGRNVGANVWIQRKAGMENERILPWNFDDVVDKEKSNEKFIIRMTNKCTYITGEDVLPKNSLLYQKYMVLNELNNLKIKGTKIDISLKQELYENLFKKFKKVTGKRLRDYLNKNYNMDLITGDLTGFDQDFKTSLSSDILFRSIFDCESLTDVQIQIAEDIIRWKTIYGDDKIMVTNIVKKNYPQLSKEEIKKINGLPKLSGWGNFSRIFLTQVFCEEMVNQETGEMSSIIDALWNTNENLMQLLSNRFGYTKKIQEINLSKKNEITNLNYEECVDGLFTSPSNKRAIWQTLLIAEEIKKIMGCEPKKIFIEMARGGGEKGKRTKSRKDQLKELYKNCEKDIRDWDYYGLSDRLEKTEDRRLNSKKLFLYYLQNGKCAYTGESIDLDELLSGNNKWDIDHIFPQSKIDDDGFDNLVLVQKKENAKKDNGLISATIQGRMHETWKYWLEKGFITKKKYSRLTKQTEFSDEELSGFIARQIVETRQSTKLIADVFNQMYENTKVVYVKANLASKFRKEPLKVLKSRMINDYHHAKDAYLNIVVGDVYNQKYTDNPYKWIKDNKNSNYSITKTMYWDVVDNNGEIIWKGCDKEFYTDNDGHERCHYLKNEKGEITGGDIDRIREIVKRDTCLYTEYTYCEKGQLFNASHERKHSGSAKIALKKNLSIEEYGGYKSANTSYFALIEFDGKKETRVKNIVGVPIYIDNMLEHNPNAFKEYCEEQLGKKNVIILKSKIKKNSLISVDGFPMRLRGENESNMILKGNLQLKVDENSYKIIRLIEKYFEKKDNNDKITVDEKYDDLSNEMLINLYSVLVDKLNSKYRNRPANQYEILSDKKEIFDELSLDDKAKVIVQILQMLRCDAATTADLKLLNAGSSKGSMKINKNTLGSSNATLINQSVSGLFENRERL